MFTGHDVLKSCRTFKSHSRGTIFNKPQTKPHETQAQTHITKKYHIFICFSDFFLFALQAKTNQTVFLMNLRHQKPESTALVEREREREL
jgi:hypothetical protein